MAVSPGAAPGGVEIVALGGDVDVPERLDLAEDHSDIRALREDLQGLGIIALGAEIVVVEEMDDVGPARS